MYRINEFEKNFGRLPEESEPLLFVEGTTVPVHAPVAVSAWQLKEAASACGVDFALIRDFLDEFGAVEAPPI